MKKTFIITGIVLMLASVLVITGCRPVLIAGKDGPTITREYDFTDFTGIKIGHAFELEVAPSDTYKISITGGENVLDRLKLSKAGSTLEIDINAWFFTWRHSPKVEITMPVLRTLNMSGASRGTVTGFRSTEDFRLELSGASRLDLDMEAGDFWGKISGASKITGYLKASDSDIEISGASHSELKGSGGDIELDVSGASQASMIDYAVDDADIEVSGASRASLTVGGRIDVTLSGASSLEYGGSPTLGNLDITGASSIKQKPGE